jgi:hypothetical protein
MRPPIPQRNVETGARASVKPFLVAAGFVGIDFDTGCLSRDTSLEGALMSDPQEVAPLGGADSLPDTAPMDRADLGWAGSGPDELGGEDAVRANDELDGEVKR